MHTNRLVLNSFSAAPNHIFKRVNSQSWQSNKKENLISQEKGKTKLLPDTEAWRDMLQKKTPLFLWFGWLLVFFFLSFWLGFGLFWLVWFFVVFLVRCITRFAVKLFTVYPAVWLLCGIFRYTKNSKAKWLMREVSLFDCKQANLYAVCILEDTFDEIAT